jgi:hypothetical protein
MLSIADKLIKEIPVNQDDKHFYKLLESGYVHYNIHCAFGSMYAHGT